MLMTETKHGDLLLAEYHADEKQVTAALKEYDRRLVLTWELDSVTHRPVWNVVLIWSPEHPAHQVLSWRENGAGEPLPLTMRIVDEVRKLRETDTVAAIDAANETLKAGIRKQIRDDSLAITEDHAPYIDRGRVQITTANVTRKPAYLRNRHLREAA